MSVFQKILIADAGPLIALTKIQQLKLLPELFSTIRITDFVSDALINAIQALIQGKQVPSALLYLYNKQT